MDIYMRKQTKITIAKNVIDENNVVNEVENNNVEQNETV